MICKKCGVDVVLEGVECPLCGEHNYTVVPGQVTTKDGGPVVTKSGKPVMIKNRKGNK